MAESGNIEILNDSLLKARQYSTERNYGRAFAHYLVVLQLLPAETRKQYEKEFTNVLHFWGSILHKRGNFENVFKCYHLATTYFPTSVEILNNLGTHSLKLKHYCNAKTTFRNCLQIDPEYLPAEQNLQTTKYALVERWHFPMLNDTIRNKAYAQAIFMEISHGFTDILDVGTGTGILSLFASKSKQCKSIFACDYSETMHEIASNVLQANNVTNIKLIKKKSHNLIIPNDLPKKVTLLVTEILDSGIFGENILDTLIHAWDNLLIPFPYGKVIPAGVHIFVTAIQSDDIARRVRVFPRENNILNINHISLMYETFPYDTENLKTTNVKYMTETKMALYVDFNNVQQLRQISQSKDNNPTVVLKCKEKGRIDAFAIWFQLQLNDSVTLNNDPNLKTQTCWDQAISLLRHPFQVEKGYELNIDLWCFEGYVELECAQTFSNKDVDKEEGFTVPRSVIYYVNDFLLMNYLEDISNRIIVETFKNCTSFSVLDLSPFPILGLLLIKHGAQLTCRVKNLSCRYAIDTICELNQINKKSIKYVLAKDFNDYTSDNVEFDLIVQNLIKPSGLLNETEIYQAQVMKYCLSERGLYLPASIYVWAQVVQCDWLNQATKVDDKNVCGFKIAQFINDYKSNEQRDINFETLPHVSLSEPVRLGSINLNDITNPHIDKINVPIIRSGRANSIFYWFEVTLIEGKSLITRRHGSFANIAAFMIESQQSLNSGDVICLALKQHKGIMKIVLNQFQ